jgi:hypothetical protein
LHGCGWRSLPSLGFHQDQTISQPLPPSQHMRNTTCLFSLILFFSCGLRSLYFHIPAFLPFFRHQLQAGAAAALFSVAVAASLRGKRLPREASGRDTRDGLFSAADPALPCLGDGGAPHTEVAEYGSDGQHKPQTRG